MKKEYTKPVMEIVSFTTENIITASGLTIATDNSGYQTSFKTISY